MKAERIQFLKAEISKLDKQLDHHDATGRYIEWTETLERLRLYESELSALEGQ